MGELLLLLPRERRQGQSSQRLCGTFATASFNHEATETNHADLTQVDNNIEEGKLSNRLLRDN